MLKTIKITLVLLVFALFVGACTSQPKANMPNPASVNCTDKGGTLTIEKNGNGDEYGVCHFEDNLQCEEWAMMNGDCPEGGLKITGYVTNAAIYCAISGGKYTITDSSGAPENEQGTCTFKSGNTCDVWDFYNGKCTK
ncbi:MAG: DUF333 domain-containing protein [Anaerolineales bacterium]|nr:DUF333 domain-containing protein [Anaerolineales bacterium]